MAQAVECLLCKCEALSSNPNPTKKKKKTAEHWWLKPVILAAHEAEIRRSQLQSQLQANSSQDPI
jgi:hypothetical protein